jgi:hypothetical protein
MGSSWHAGRALPRESRSLRSLRVSCEVTAEVTGQTMGEEVDHAARVDV